MNDEKGIIERINELIEDSMMTVSAFASNVGIDAGNLRKKLAGNQSITKRDIELICRHRSVSTEWLRTGEGDKRPSNDSMQTQIKDEIIKLSMELTKNTETINKAMKENERITNQLNSLYSQLEIFKCV